MEYLLMLAIGGTVLLVSSVLLWGLLAYGSAKLLDQADLRRRMSRIAGSLGRSRGPGERYEYTPAGDAVRGWAALNGIDPDF